MRHLGRSLLIGTLAALLSLLAGFVGLARFYRVYSWQGLDAYQCMASECHPAWSDYHFGRIRAGADIEEVIRQTKPAIVERHGRWVTIRYHEPGSSSGLAAHAYDGELLIAYASSCAWVRLFFDELSEVQSQEIMGVSKQDPRRFGIVPVYR